MSKGSALLNKMRRVCEKLDSFEDQCNVILNNTLKQLTELEENNKLFMVHSNRRTKRAPFEFLYHILFGIINIKLV